MYISSLTSHEHLFYCHIEIMEGWMDGGRKVIRCKDLCFTFRLLFVKGIDFQLLLILFFLGRDFFF